MTVDDAPDGPSLKQAFWAGVGFAVSVGSITLSSHVADQPWASLVILLIACAICGGVSVSAVLIERRFKRRAAPSSVVNTSAALSTGDAADGGATRAERGRPGAE